MFLIFLIQLIGITQNPNNACFMATFLKLDQVNLTINQNMSMKRLNVFERSKNKVMNDQSRIYILEIQKLFNIFGRIYYLTVSAINDN
jgi:hypothetical protein